MLPLIKKYCERSDSEQLDSVALEEIIKKLEELDFLTLESYKKMNKTNTDPQFVHDLDNIFNVALGYRQMVLLYRDKQKNVKRYLKNFLYPALSQSLILEDLLSRGEDNDIRPEIEKRSLKLGNIRAVLEKSSQIFSVGGANEKISFDKFDDNILKEDEEVLTVPGVIVNSLLNMIRNSDKKRIDASFI